MSTDKQDQLIKLCCSVTEKNVIQANAAAAGMKTSTYLRELGLRGTSVVSRGLYQAAQAPGAKLQLNVQANELLQYLYELIQKISAEDLVQPEGKQRLEQFAISLLEARRAITFEGVDAHVTYQDLNQAFWQLMHPDLVALKEEVDQEVYKGSNHDD
ncbi:MAG: hypothetical protein AAGF01_25170 [Cyanobacteria bacterium P01_G01_bin.38]